MATRIARSLALRFISKPNCPLCTEAREELEALATRKGVKLQIQDIDILQPQNKNFHDEFVFEIPVVQLADSGEELFRHRLNESKVSNFLDSYFKGTSL
jgi:glutaredoxin